VQDDDDFEEVKVSVLLSSDVKGLSKREVLWNPLPLDQSLYCISIIIIVFPKKLTNALKIFK